MISQISTIQEVHDKIKIFPILEGIIHIDEKWIIELGKNWSFVHYTFHASFCLATIEKTVHSEHASSGAVVVVWWIGVHGERLILRSNNYFTDITLTLSVFCNPCCISSGIASWILVLILLTSDVPENSQQGIAISPVCFHMIMSVAHGIRATQRLQHEWYKFYCFATLAEFECTPTGTPNK